MKAMKEMKAMEGKNLKCKLRIMCKYKKRKNRKMYKWKTKQPLHQKLKDGSGSSNSSSSASRPVSKSSSSSSLPYIFLSSMYKEEILWSSVISTGMIHDVPNLSSISRDFSKTVCS